MTDTAFTSREKINLFLCTPWWRMGSGAIAPLIF